MGSDRQDLADDLDSQISDVAALAESYGSDPTMEQRVELLEKQVASLAEMILVSANNGNDLARQVHTLARLTSAAVGGEVPEAGLGIRQTTLPSA